MKDRINDILNGIADALFPSIDNSIKRVTKEIEKEQIRVTEVNRARLTASILTWLLAIALLKGWISFSDVGRLFSLIF